MAIYARGQGFQVKLMHKGVTYRDQFTSRADAEAWEADVRGALARGQAVPMAGPGTTKTSRIVDLGGLLEHAKAIHWRSKKSGESLAATAEVFVRHVGPRTSVETALSGETIHAYVQSRMVDHRNSAGTINRHLSAISVLANKVAVPLKLIPGRIDLPWQVEGKGRLRYYSIEEERQIYTLVTTWGRWEYADLFVWLVDTGARLGETRKILWSDIRDNRITFDATLTKGGKTRTITATPRVMAMITRLKHEYGHMPGPFHWVKDRPLRSLWDRLRACLPWMDEHCVVHTYRHTCASRLAMAGVSEVQIMRWMGHSSTATTQRYMHLSPATMDDLASRLTGHIERETSRAAAA
jgi:integrase